MFSEIFAVFLLFGNIATFGRSVDGDDYTIPYTDNMNEDQWANIIEKIGEGGGYENNGNEDDEDDLESKGLLHNDPFLVKFYFYKKLIPVCPQELKYENKPLSIKDIKYDSKNPWKILVHGLGQTSRGKFPCLTKSAYLKSKMDFNILVVDWGVLAGANTPLAPAFYLSAVCNVKIVGAHLANLIIELQKAGAIKTYSQVHLVGFSLGAHVVGIAGHEIFAKTKQKVGRITGLDPAGPKFSESKNKTKKLGKEAAVFVDVIHTNAAKLGNSDALGHVDFYPDGGEHQKICDGIMKDLTGSCSHNQAPALFTKTINEPKTLMACKCEPWSYAKYKSCSTSCKEGIPMGEHCPSTATGSYYLQP